jgi:hypothetical protein
LIVRKSDFDSDPAGERERGQLSVAQALSRDSLIWNETRDLAGNLGDFAYSSCSFINNLELLAESGGFEPPIELLTL